MPCRHGQTVSAAAAFAHRCQGDASRLCCDVDALGKVVVATGRLEAVTGKDPLVGLAQWKLAGDLALCVDAEHRGAEKR
jgi:hypothetical protein